MILLFAITATEVCVLQLILACAALAGIAGHRFWGWLGVIGGVLSVLFTPVILAALAMFIEVVFKLFGFGRVLGERTEEREKGRDAKE